MPNEMRYTEMRYTKEHEWARVEGAAVEGARVTMGITDYAQSELGDVVFVDLPQVGRSFKRGETLATVESVKAVSEVYAPLSGTVNAINQELTTRPELVNQEPFGSGWFCELTPADPAEVAELLSDAQYRALVAEVAK